MRKVIDVNVEGSQGRARSKKIWIVCEDMKEKGDNEAMAADRDLWKWKTYFTDPE